ncbi:YceI family protein [Pseudoclavibacter sp. 13-3]|uniref:YceI family protein n=1 Tax=Pseudoclavibacter sp. 13-3 TaxID=2901228 RepID=UPI001E64A970|nr:YceI family protein [Pseudoclavibacter sp. 13-3]MCD7100628.1 YceI family protein [Pseudoclavibacter sp. 13-3]
MTDSAIAGFTTGTWQIDSSHSSISFSVRHLVTKFRGSFTEFAATLTTGENELDSSVTAEIQAASISTGNPDRDGHLRTPDFFDAENHPELTFRSTAVTRSGDDLVVTGDLTLRGVTQSVDFSVEIGGIATSPYGQTVLGLEANTTIQREQFGLEWNSTLEAGGVLLGSDVKIHIEAEFVLDQQ